MPIGSRIADSRWTDTGTMTLNEGILLLLAVYMLGVGVHGMLAPGKASGPVIDGPTDGRDG
jgi:hypothetical protein